jgi:hypothetical protein
MSEPAGGFPGDLEGGGWSGDDSEAVLTLGSQGGSRGGASSLDQLPSGAPSVLESIGTWPPADWGAEAVPDRPVR